MKRVAGIFAVAVSSVLGVAPAQARMPVGIEAHGGWSWFTMGAVNDSLSSLNDNIGARLDPIHGGPAWGVGFRLWSSRDVLLRFGFEKLLAASEDPNVRFSVGAHAYSLGATYYPPSTRRVRFGYGLGLGAYDSMGEISSSGARLGTKGAGYGLCLSTEALVPLRNGWSMTGTLGYRLAGIWDLKFGNATSDLAAQYFGPFLRVSIAVDSHPLARQAGPILLGYRDEAGHFRP